MAHKRSHDEYIQGDTLEKAMPEGSFEAQASEKLIGPCKYLHIVENHQFGTDRMLVSSPRIAERDESIMACNPVHVLDHSPDESKAVAADPPNITEKEEQSEPGTTMNHTRAAVEDLSAAVTKFYSQLLSVNALKPNKNSRTLESFTLYVVKDGTPFYWNIAKQQLLPAPCLCKKATKLHLGKLLVKICRVLAFTATETSQNELSKFIPNDVLDVVLPQGIHNMRKNSSVIRGWSKRVVKKQFVQDGPTYGATRLGTFGLWPPPEASPQLRQEMWELCFVPDIVELVFGAWHGSGVLDLRKIMSAPDSNLCKWLWHVYVVLLEIKFRFQVPAEQRMSSYTLPREQLSEGVAQTCLRRESWDDVIDHFEMDVLSTWEGDRIDYKAVYCTRGFGKKNITDGSAKWKFLQRFTADLRHRAPDSFPPLLRQHFQDNPPGFSGRSKAPPPKTTIELNENNIDSVLGNQQNI